MSGILLVCTGCERHVKNGDCICPFCGTKVACVAGSGAKVPQGLSRAALLALGAAGTLSTAMSGCFSQALYGAPVPAGTGGYGGEGQTSSVTGQSSTSTQGQTASSTGQGGAGGAGGDGGAGGEMPDAGKD